MRACVRCGKLVGVGGRYGTCKECKNEYSRKWNASNRDRVRETTAAWYQNNKEKKKKAVDDWIVANREKKREQTRRRRAVLRGAEGHHTIEDLERIRIFQKDQCNLCGCDLCGCGELDHIIPASRGGSEWPSNLQWLCTPCNRWKSDKLLPAIPRLRNPLKVRLEKGWCPKVLDGRLYADYDGRLVLQRADANGLHRPCFPWELFD